jgi:hypothetical protein
MDRTYNLNVIRLKLARYYYREEFTLYMLRLLFHCNPRKGGFPASEEDQDVFYMQAKKQRT